MRFRKLAAVTPLLLAIALVALALGAGDPAAQTAAPPAAAVPDTALKPPVTAPAKTKKPGIPPATRRSWMVGFGLGYGTAKPSVSGVRPEAENGGTTNLRFGYAVSPRTVVGAEFSSWSAKPDSQEWVFRGSVPSITWYDLKYLPKGSFLRAGVGYGKLKTTVTSISIIYDPNLPPYGGNRPDTTTYVLNDDGFSMLGAIGYEFRWRRHWAFAPQAEYMYITTGGGISAYVASASLQVNLYW